MKTEQTPFFYVINLEPFQEIETDENDVKRGLLGAFNHLDTNVLSFEVRELCGSLYRKVKRREALTEEDWEFLINCHHKIWREFFNYHSA